MKLIGIWVFIVGVLLTLTGVWSIFDFLARDLDLQLGIGALIRVVNGTTFIMISMAIYRAHQYLEQPTKFEFPSLSKLLKGNDDDKI
ncbi:membrane protein [Mycobacterium phage Indlulamithi]|uniref:Uncharacterized protein n=1 Tax=Mycobacterium phage Indlulamithi TaxID=2656582 RepID=A0A649VDE2_9CAUD|nr:membrane protein [Mycobacterium phage Indlulamithi]QGJ90139.1 hypothetical protein PBI_INDLULAMITHI_102 [Mycobacterium phage Indlulamithi]